MSDTSTSARPRQVTTAAGLVIGGSLFLLVSVFDTVSRLRSVETREQVTEALSSPAGEGLGLSVSQALSLMRVGLTVAAICAAVALVAGIFVLQKHHGARIALSVAAVPLLLTAPLTGGLLGVLVVAATTMLWSGPARDWYAGRPVRESSWGGPGAARRDQASPGSRDDRDRSRSVDRPGAPGVGGPTGPPPPGSTPEHEQGRAGTTSVTTLPEVAPEVAPDGTPDGGDRPPATQGFGAPRGEATPAAWLPQQGWPGAPGPQVQGNGAPGQPRRAPRPVTVACLVTWLFSGLVIVLYGVVLGVLVTAPDTVLDPLRESPQWQQALEDTQLAPEAVESVLLPSMVVVLLLSILWAVAACVLAYLVRRGHNWARWTLVASAGVTFLVAIAAFPVGVVVQLAAAVVIGLLLHPETRDWFAQGPRGGAGPSGPGQPVEHPHPARPERPGPW